MRHLVLLFLLACCTGAPERPLIAGDGQMPPGSGQLSRMVPPVALLFVDFDADRDGVVTADESARGAAVAFIEADADRNGVVGLIELADWSARRLGDPGAVPGRFNFDRDNSDSVSPAEFAAEINRRFAAADADRDGRLKRSEMLVALPARGPGGKPPSRMSIGAPEGARMPPQQVTSR